MICAGKKYENGATKYSISLGANCIASSTIVLASLKLDGPSHSIIEFASLSSRHSRSPFSSSPSRSEASPSQSARSLVTL
jgi:hypothetical protein